MSNVNHATIEAIALKKKSLKSKIIIATGDKLGQAMELEGELTSLDWITSLLGIYSDVEKHIHKLNNDSEAFYDLIKSGELK